MLSNCITNHRGLEQEKDAPTVKLIISGYMNNVALNSVIGTRNGIRTQCLELLVWQYVYVSEHLVHITKNQFEMKDLAWLTKYPTRGVMKIDGFNRNKIRTWYCIDKSSDIWSWTFSIGGMSTFNFTIEKRYPLTFPTYLCDCRFSIPSNNYKNNNNSNTNTEQDASSVNNNFKTIDIQLNTSQNYVRVLCAQIGYITGFTICMEDDAEYRLCTFLEQRGQSITLADFHTDDATEDLR